MSITAQDAYVTKGVRISFRFLKTKELGTYSIAGVQTKFLADEISGSGVIRNVWADDPLGQKNLRFNVEQDDGSFVEVPARGLLAVLKPREDGSYLSIPVTGVERVDP